MEKNEVEPKSRHNSARDSGTEVTIDQCFIMTIIIINITIIVIIIVIIMNNTCSQVSGSEDEEVEEELETDGRALVERIVITLR